jgi:hypothetical protein
VSARRQNRQPRSHGASHVEQREAVDYRVELIQTVDLCKAPGGVDLIAVRQADKLRASGRAAGMEERAYGVAVRRKPEVQGGALRQQALIEADDLTARIAFAADDQNPLKRRHAVDDRVGLLPELRIIGFGGNDKHGRLFGDQKISDRVCVEQKVDRAGDARDLRANESGWHSGQRGAKEGDGAVDLRYAQRPEKIG